MSTQHLFTSESVSAGHPDKIADQISDAVLDAILAQDLHARVACETFIKTGFVLVGGEITTKGWVNIEKLVRDTITNIGYNHSDVGFDGNSCAVLNAIGKQSIDIAKGVDHSDHNCQGAGDQGLMFGYACDETAALMPAPITYAHLLMKRHAELRKKHILPWLRPDAKSQVTLLYENDIPVAVASILVSTQHAPNIAYHELKEAVIENIIKPVIPKKWLTKSTKLLVNPTGKFVIGGPMGDCGLTGRKIIVDTYGGMAHHGGGAFSGKDPSKVDRSAAYMARYIAKNIVAAKIAKRCEIQLCYAIGIAQPLAIYVNTFGTGKVADHAITAAIYELFDLRPGKIIEELNLLNPIYSKTAVYGHFGRTEKQFTWEKTDKTDLIKDYLKVKNGL